MKRPLSVLRRCLPALPLHFFWDSPSLSDRKSLRIIPQLETLEDRLAPASFTWTGGGTTNNWSDPHNWSSMVPGAVPGASDTAIFNNTSTKAAIVDTGFAGTVAAIQINSGYTGTLTLKEALNDTGSFSQAAGILKTNGFTLSVGGNTSITGGTFSNTTGILNLNGSSSNLNAPTAALGNVTVNAAGTITTTSSMLSVGSLALNSGTLVAPSGNLTVAGNFVDNGCAFNANGGTLVFASSSGGHTVNVSGASGGTVSLNNLTLADSGSGTRTYTLTGTLDVSGNFSEMPAGSSTNVAVNGGRIAVLGNVSVSAGANGGTTDLQFDGTASQSYSATGGILPTVEIANASDTVSAAAGTTNLGVQSLTLTSGNFVAPTGTLTILNNLVQTAGTFNANGGTVVFAAASGNHTITVSSPLPLNNLAFEDRGSGTRTYTLTGTLNVAGNFSELPASSSTTVVVNGGTIAVLGNVSVAPGANGGTTDLQFTGSAGQTYTATGGTLPSVEINKSSGAVSAAAGTTSLVVQSLTLTNGVFVAPSGTLTIVSNLTQTSGTLNPNGGTVLFDTSSGGHSININGGAAGLLTLNNLIFGDSGSGTRTYTIAPGDGFYLDGNFTAQVQAGSTAAMYVNGGIFDVFGTITLGTGYHAGKPAPVFNALTPGTGAISGAVYDDENGSGQEQSTDPGLLGWTVKLLDSGNNVIATQTTGSTGGYSFLNLTPGNYSVQEVPQSGYTPTTATSVPITVSAGTDVVANFGNFQNITIAGTVFNDANADGQQELNELGIPNTMVQLYTVTNGHVSANPLQTTTTDANGNYSFTNLGPLAQGESYVVAQVMPAGTSQTKPASGSNTITLPDGRIGWRVPATGGVNVNIAGQPGPNISGTGSYTLNKLNDPTTAVVKFNDGAGHSGTDNTYLSQFNVTYSNGVNAPVTFNTFCIDLIDRVSAGGTYSVAVQPDLAPTYVNAGAMTYIFQNFGMSNLSNNPTQAAAVQIAEWDLSLNNHTPTQFVKDADGTYSSGDESIFSVNFGSNPNASAIGALVNQYLHVAAGATNTDGWLDSSVIPSGPQRGQCLLIPQNQYNFGDFTPPSAVPDSSCVPPAMYNENPNQNDAGPVDSSTHNPSVQESTGVVDSAATIFGSGGQDPLSLTISWSNGSYSAGSNMGSGINNSLTPSIVEVNGTQTLAVEIGGTDALYFDYNGTNYVERFGGNDQLTYNPGTLEYTLDDTMGDQIVFWGFDASLPVGQRGSFQSLTDPGGNVTQVTSRTTTGQIADTQRSASSGGNTTTESFQYSYFSSGVNAGLVQNITLERQINGGPIDVVRQAVLTYYDGTEPYGNVGDLEFVTVEDGSSNMLGTYYYRYYTPADAGSVGYVGGLKYYFSEQSYARLTAAVGNATSASGSQVAPYADNYFQYDASHRLTESMIQGQGCSVCSGGLGTFTYSYTTSSNVPGYNSWAVKTIMTHPDGSTDTIYSNFAGERMLDAFTDTTTGVTTDTYYRYDDAGRVILTAQPSAVTGYNDSYADLVNYQNGTYQYVSANSGLIDLTTYYTTTTATATTPGGVTGYVYDHAIEQGYNGTPILQDTTTYFLQTANGVSYAPEATHTVYRYDDGTGAETTSYTYTWYPNSVRIQSKTTTLPVISATENGPGVADQTQYVYDTYGRQIWGKDGDGYITYTAYDTATGRVTESIQDVNTSDTGEFQNLPAGWVTPAGGGLNLVTTYQIDALGRPTQVTDPNGNVTYAVYDDVNHEVRIYQGWNSTTDMPTGPTLVARQDWANGYNETLTMSAAPHLTGGVPDGTEAIADVQTLTRTYRNPAGQNVREDDYFNLSGVIYSTTPYLGTANTNYYTTTFAYDDAGRLAHVQMPTGTITDRVYDGRGDVLNTWVGTNDTPANGQEWSPSNNTSPANMTETTAYVYDNGGVGDDNLTQMTQYPGGGAAPRVTQYFFDWRDRQVADKDGVSASENDGTNRPIYYTTYDNLNEATSQSQYDGDGVTINTVNGVPQPPNPSLLRIYTTTEYDDQGRVYQTNMYDVNPTNGSISTNSLTTNYYYDHRGDVIAESDPGGLWTKDVYDGAGRLVTDYTTDGAGGTTWADADSVANDTVLEQVQTIYDADSNVIETRDSLRFHNDTSTGPLGTSTGTGARVYDTTNYYDAANRLTTTVDVGTYGGTAYVRPATPPAPSDTALVTSYDYNAAGWVQNVVDPRGLDTRMIYDNLGRTTETIENYTNGVPTNNTNGITQYTYDGDNHVLTQTAVQPAGTPSQTTQYVYGVTTAGGSALDSNDLRAAILYPDPTTGQPSTNPNQEATYTYNALGQEISRTDRNGTTHQYSYDVLGRHTSDTVTQLGTGVDGSIRRIDMAYDGQGNAYLYTSYADTAGTQIANQVEQVYDGLSQLTGEYQSHSGAVVPGTTPEVQYHYNEMSNGENNSRLESMTYPNGRVLNYNYNAGLDDSISRLSSISDNSGVLEAYTYLGLNTVVERDHPQTGVNLTYISPNGSTGDAGDQYTGLDRFGRVVEQLWLNTTTNTATDDFTYTYDRDGNVLTKSNQLDVAFSEQYSYDGFNQLTSFSRNNGHSQSWALDALGNWTSVTTDGSTQTRTANAQNQYTSVSGGGVTPTYDNNGNLTTDPTNGHTYVYDAWNRLVAVQNGGNTLTSYTYDAQGRRITETSSGTQTDLYYNDQWQVIEERVNGQTQTQYVWDPLASDTLVERDSYDSNGNIILRLYAQQDVIGNVTVLVDTSGNVVERFVYDPYGQLTVLDASWNVLASDAYHWVYLYQAGRYDSISGLYNFHNRDYSPSLGRWLQQDPLGYSDGMNLYDYVKGDPLKFTDPTGLKAWWEGYKYLCCRKWEKVRDALKTFGFTKTNGLCDCIDFLDSGNIFNATSTGVPIAGVSAAGGLFSPIPLGIPIGQLFGWLFTVDYCNSYWCTDFYPPTRTSRPAKWNEWGKFRVTYTCSRGGNLYDASYITDVSQPAQVYKHEENLTGASYGNSATFGEKTP
jgi:RHS repeat-associated protein